MGVMSELSLSVKKISRMLDNHISPNEIADRLDVPVSYVDYVVELRLAKIQKDYEYMQYAENSAAADAIHYGRS